MKYDFKQVEKKWQDIWDKEHTFAAKQDYTLPKYYALVEFPYPSGQGLHVGHPRSYTALDIVAVSYTHLDVYKRQSSPTDAEPWKRRMSCTA